MARSSSTRHAHTSAKCRQMLLVVAVSALLAQMAFANVLHSVESVDSIDRHHHRHRRVERGLSSDSGGGGDSDNDDSDLNAREPCAAVRAFVPSIEGRLDDDRKGAVCGGHCCSNSTEGDLRRKATGEFERLLHHHTESVRGILKSTASLFQNYVLELVEQSQNKTLNIFAQVYRKMVPLSKKLINNLYTDILSHLNTTSFNANSNTQNLSNNLDAALHRFFVNLFPVAYHQAVHLSKDNNGELHEDYVSCLKHTYDELQPFGPIPKEIKRSMVQSVQTATVFVSALLQSSDVLSGVDELYANSLTETCQRHLLKLGYCPSCNGLRKSEVKPCYSYCMNVFRGCSAQYGGILDSPWSSVVEAMDNLVMSHIRSDSGIVTTIKQLDVKLSETIMRAMENGPELEKKVTKTCGTPKLIPILEAENDMRPMSPHSIKWSTPPDTEILRFLSTIDKSKEFFSSIVNNICEDDETQHSDHHCWTGDRIGDYTQLVMTTGVDTQRYNPEVPLESSAQSANLNELVDKLIKIRKSIGSAMPSAIRPYSDVQGDMALHGEEGSGRMPDDVDDEEYATMHGSGDGSGDGSTTSPFDPLGPTVIANNDIELVNQPSNAQATTATTTTTTTALTVVTLVTIILACSSYSLAH